jgi:adenosylcobinamide-GDP ribazoletransferase
VLSALSFLTVAGRGRAPDSRTFRWFPLVGALIGGVVAATWRGSGELWTPAVAAGLAVAADLAVTGLLHFDGLADSVDGLLPHLDRDRRLAVMRTPDVGGFALAVVPMVLLLRWAALAGGGVHPWSIVAVWCISRTVVAAVPAVVPYARDQGLAASFLDGGRPWFVLALVPAFAGLGWEQGGTGLVGGLAAVVGVVAVVALARQRLGGFTGDVLGAAIVVGETAALLALAARP